MNSIIPIRDHPRLDRMFSSIDISYNGCMLWPFSRSTKGYGLFRISGKRYNAHRASYELFIGPIPEGYCVCHACDTPACVNPFHLFAGTHSDNTKDAVRKGRVVPPPQSGTANNASKLTPELVVSIRLARKKGATFRGIAEMFNVSHSTVARVINRENWGFVM